jgi:hypothetical protein
MESARLEVGRGLNDLDSRQVAASPIRRSDLLNCLLLVAIPIVMSIVNSEWLYTPIRGIDPWVNVGYFLHYADPEFGAGYYKAARLSWIIPGFIAYHVFQPVVANYVLHMGCLILSVLFLYLTIARLFGTAVAFAIAACFAVFIHIHGSGGWDYQNAAAGAFYIVALYTLTHAVLSKTPHWPAIGAGAAYAAAVHATIGFVNLAPILVFHCFALYRYQYARSPSWRYVLTFGTCVLSGALALTVLLGLFNIAVGREFIFFRQLLELVISYVGDSQMQAAWWLPWSEGWFLDVSYLSYLILGVAVLVGCIICTIWWMLGWRINAIAVCLQAQYIFIALLWVLWQSLGHTALQPDYFAYPLYPVMFFALAGIATARRQPAGTSRAGVIFYIFVALIVALTLCFPFLSPTLSHLTDRHVQLILVASALVVVGLFAISGGRPTMLSAAVLAFAAMNGFEAAAPGIEQLYSISAGCAYRSSGYMALVDSNLFLNRFVRTSRKVYVWWNEHEVFKDEQCGVEAKYFAISLTSLGLFQYLGPPWEGIPADALPESSIAAMTDDSAAKIAIPTANYANVQAIMARYRQAGVALAVEGKTIIRTPRFSFSLYVLGVNL